MNQAARPPGLLRRALRLRRTQNLVRYGVYALVAVAAVGAVFFTATFLGRRSATQTFTAAIAEVDAALGVGARTRGAELLRAAGSRATSQLEHLQVLSRGYRLARADDSWPLFDELARGAVRQLPGSQPLQQIAIYAALQAGDPQRARTLAERAVGAAGTGGRARGSPPLQLQFLAAEALLRADPRDPTGSAAAGVAGGAAADELAPDLRRLLALAVPLPVSDRDAAALAEQGARYSSALVLDAALVHLARGELLAAHSLFTDHLRGAEYDLAAALAAYDAGALDTALDRLYRYQARFETDPLTLLIEADLHLQRGALDAATERYQRLIQLAPGYSWLPYVNLAYLTLAGGELETAFAILAAAAQRFPQSAQVTAGLARVYLAADQGLDAARMTERLRAVAGDTLEVELALLELDAPTMRAEPYTARLWRLASDHPGHERVTRVLATRLMSLGDADGARMLLAQFEREMVSREQLVPRWLLELQGIGMAMRADLAGSTTMLEASMTGGPVGAVVPWTTPYNLAVVMLADGDPRGAERRLHEAERLLRSGARVRTAALTAALGGLGAGAGAAGTGEDASQPAGGGAAAALPAGALSLIGTRMAEVRLTLGERDAALEQLTAALQLDPTNLRARVLRNRLAADFAR